MVPKTRVTAEHVSGVVGGDAVVYEVVHTYQMWSMPHIPLIKQWDSISIYASSSLDHYTTNGGIWFQLLVPKNRVIAYHVLGVVGGDAVLCGVIHPCQMWSVPHITLIKQWDNISMYASSSLDHYTANGGIWFQLLVPKNRVIAHHVSGVVGGDAVLCWVIPPVRRGLCLI